MGLVRTCYTTSVLLDRASIPTGPNVLVLPGDGKSLEQFQTDDALCRPWSALQTGTSVQVHYDIAYAQCMFAKGNQVSFAY